MSEWKPAYGYTFVSRPKRAPGHCWNDGPYLVCYGNTGATYYDTRKFSPTLNGSLPPRNTGAHQ